MTPYTVDEKTLSETFGNLEAVRCSMVTTKPFLAPEITLKTPPESQIQNETLHRFKSCWILFRNVHACNRWGVNFSAKNPISKTTIFFKHFGFA